MHRVIKFVQDGQSLKNIYVSFLPSGFGEAVLSIFRISAKISTKFYFTIFSLSELTEIKFLDFLPFMVFLLFFVFFAFEIYFLDMPTLKNSRSELCLSASTRLVALLSLFFRRYSWESSSDSKDMHDFIKVEIRLIISIITSFLFRADFIRFFTVFDPILGAS